MTHETLTIEVAVYDFAKWYRGIGGNKPWYTHNEYGRTQRWVVQKILDALERFPEESAEAA